MDVEKVTNEIIEFIKDYYKKNNLKGAIIGISGGKDSAVVAGLFAKALGSENVIGIWMPCHSKDEDYLNALLVSKTFGFELKEFDLTNIYESYVRQIKEVNDVSDNVSNLELDVFGEHKTVFTSETWQAIAGTDVRENGTALGSRSQTAGGSLYFLLTLAN